MPAFFIAPILILQVSGGQELIILQAKRSVGATFVVYYTPKFGQFPHINLYIFCSEIVDSLLVHVDNHPSF